MARKSYFTISEIAKVFKVKKSHIRFYEKKGLISLRNNKLGRRIYNHLNSTHKCNALVGEKMS
jgi:DNA-binding transcriptional MerR regulator